MKANSFNKIKIFCGSASGLEEVINKFLKENSGKIKITKRSINAVSWGKPRSWHPSIQITLGYREQKVAYRERVAILSFEQLDGYKVEESCNKQMAENNIEAVDILTTSYVSNFQYSYISSFVAIFMES
jgi:hypothetical protein